MGSFPPPDLTLVPLGHKVSDQSISDVQHSRTVGHGIVAGDAEIGSKSNKAKERHRAESKTNH